MLILKDRRLLALIVACGAMAGCNMGMAPTGGSAAEIEANFHRESPQDQIRTIQMSPASPERKAQMIKDIETKYGIKAPGDTAPAAAAPLPPSHG